MSESQLRALSLDGLKRLAAASVPASAAALTPAHLDLLTTDGIVRLLLKWEAASPAPSAPLASAVSALIAADANAPQRRMSPRNLDLLTIDGLKRLLTRSGVAFPADAGREVYEQLCASAGIVGAS